MSIVGIVGIVLMVGAIASIILKEIRNGKQIRGTVMRDLINKWWNRKWSNWEIHRDDFLYDINRDTDWKKITTLKRISNDGLIQYKTIKNY